MSAHVAIIGTHEGSLAVAECIGQSIIKVIYPANLNLARNLASHMVLVYGCTRIIDRFATTQPVVDGTLRHATTNEGGQQT